MPRRGLKRSLEWKSRSLGCIVTDAFPPEWRDVRGLYKIKSAVENRFERLQASRLDKLFGYGILKKYLLD